MELEDTDSTVEIRRAKHQQNQDDTTEQQQRAGSARYSLFSYVRIPSMANFIFVFVVTCSVLYKGLTSGLFYLIFRLVFGTLYPAYASYKAVRTKNVKEYVKWMMYWIVFALFSCAETFTDVFLSWFPFYYEIKIILVLWLLSPATKGSSILYRKFVHPTLSKREQEIDDYISKAKEQGYHTVLNLGTKGVNYATNVIMQTAIKGGGGIVNQIRKSYSLSDLSQTDLDGHGCDEADDVVMSDPRQLRRRRSPRRSASGSPKVDMYFSEVDIRQRSTGLDHIRSTEDISSGYSSAEPIYGGAQIRKTGSRENLVRSGSMNAGTVRPRTRSTRSSTTTSTAVSKKNPSTEESGMSEDEADSSEFDNVMPVYKKPAKQIEKVINVIENAEPELNKPLEEMDIKIEKEIEPPAEEQLNQSIEQFEEPSPFPLSRSSSDDVDFFDTDEGAANEQKVDNELLIDNDTVVTNNVSVLIGNESCENLTSDTSTNVNLNENVIGNVEKYVSEMNSIPCESEMKCVNENVVLENKEIQESYDKKEDNQGDPSSQKTSTPNPQEIENHVTSVRLQDTNAEVSGLANLRETTPKPCETEPSDSRAGKYHKKAAPSPPDAQTYKNPNSQHLPDSQPIKATLVLKPGIVKSTESPTRPEIFVSRSPKPKRKESSSPIAKLKLLPKKLNFWHHKEPDTLSQPQMSKRVSWHEESGVLELGKNVLVKEQSKSNEVLVSLRSENESGERVVGNLTLRQLSESPGRRRTEKE